MATRTPTRSRASALQREGAARPARKPAARRTGRPRRPPAPAWRSGSTTASGASCGPAGSASPICRRHRPPDRHQRPRARPRAPPRRHRRWPCSAWPSWSPPSSGGGCVGRPGDVLHAVVAGTFGRVGLVDPARPARPRGPAAPPSRGRRGPWPHRDRAGGPRARDLRPGAHRARPARPVRRRHGDARGRRHPRLPGVLAAGHRRHRLGRRPAARFCCSSSGCWWSPRHRCTRSRPGPARCATGSCAARLPTSTDRGRARRGRSAAAVPLRRGRRRRRQGAFADDGHGPRAALRRARSSRLAARRAGCTDGRRRTGPSSSLPPAHTPMPASGRAAAALRRRHLPAAGQQDPARGVGRTGPGPRPTTPSSSH